MNRPARYALASLVFVATLLAVAGLALAVVIVFAGPHSDMLPAPLQIVVYVAGWAAILVVPFLAARAVWRRT